MRTTCLNSIYQLAKEHSDIIFIGSDLGYKVLEDFALELPRQFYMEGISEAHIIGMASAMAHENNVVFVNTIASFLVRRCFEQIVLNMCLDNANVRLIANGGGVVYGPQGPTHTIIDDLALLSSIPNMTVISPADRWQIKKIIAASYEHNGPMYIRLARDTEMVVTNHAKFEFGQPTLLCQGEDVAIISTGFMTQTTYAVVQKLKADGFAVKLIDVHCLKPLATELIIEMLHNISIAIVVEEHSIDNGLYAQLVKLIYEQQLNIKLLSKAIPNNFIERYGNHEQLLELFELDEKSIYQFCYGVVSNYYE